MIETTEREKDWELMGAASGLVAGLLFVVAFVIFLTTDPGGGNTPQLPDIARAQAAPAFIADNLNAIRAQVMLNGLAIIAFLWFLGTLWATLRRAEGDPGRGSMITVAGALVGSTLTLVGLMLLGTATLTTGAPQAATVPTLYVGASVSLAFGGAAFAIFFLGVAEVSLRAGALATWLGMLAILAALVSILGLVTPYYTDGVLNPATGALGFYAHYLAFVVWLLLGSAGMALTQRRRHRAQAATVVSQREPSEQGVTT